MVQIGVRQSPVEFAKPDDGRIDMFVACTADGIEDADGRQKRHRLARRGQQLFNGLRVIAGLAERAIVQHCELVGAYNQRIARIDRYGFGLLARQVAREFLGREACLIGFVHFRVDHLETVEEAIQQAAPVGRRRSQ